jgi:hypothetical protein
MSERRLRIFRGQDKNYIVRLTNSKTKDPISLAGATLIQVIFEKEDRTKLVLSSVTKPAVKAQGTLQSVVFTAIVAGASGNGIILAFNGVDTLDEVVLAWNTANPTNAVGHNAVDGSTVLITDEIQLVGGYQEYQPVKVFGNEEIGKLEVIMKNSETNLLRAGIGKSFTVVIDKGENPTGIRNVGNFEQKVDIKESHLD